MPILKQLEFDFSDTTEPKNNRGGVAPKAPVVTRNTRWARPPDRAEWHLVRGPDGGARIPVCGAVVWLPVAGEATLGSDRAHVFGPVCGICVREA